MESLNRESAEEYGKAVRDFYQSYRILKGYYGDLRMRSHFSWKGGNWIKIEEFVSGMPLRTIVYVKTDEEIGDMGCYLMATDRIKDMLRQEAAER